MSKTIELRKQLTKIFKTVIDEVHYEVVPDTSPYPYLSFELDEIRNVSGKSFIIAEVNILDRGKSRLVEEIADNLQNTLHKYYFINNKIQFTSYKLVRNIVQEEDKKIRRRRLTFEIQLHELKEE